MNNHDDLPKLKPYQAAFCVILLICAIAFLNWQDYQVAQLIEQERIAAIGDFTDSGVGCLDDCLDAASAPRVSDTINLTGGK